ncbi:MAG TPA: hypothetical protein VJT31_19170 [Rugosimonospora sp.]|nr:hypothetical protein [Rugosimonospora sp.]
MRPRLVLLMLLVAALGAVVLAVPATRTGLSQLGKRTRATVTGTPVADSVGLRLAAQAAPPPPTLHSAPVSINTSTAFFGWALLDRGSGTITGSANDETGHNTTESMIKAWIVSDYLRTHPNTGTTTLNELKLAILDSNDDVAQKYYQIDGGNVVVQRLISMCGLRHTTIKTGWWSMTQMTPADAVRYGLCVASGKAAGTKWTSWVLQTMHNVRGTVNDQPADQKTGGGRWGIIDGLPTSLAAQVSIKNGWTFIFADNLWHVNCLAILPSSVLVVMMRYAAPDSVTGLKVGAGICASVTRQLVYTPDL